VQPNDDPQSLQIAAWPNEHRMDAPADQPRAGVHYQATLIANLTGSPPAAWSSAALRGDDLKEALARLRDLVEMGCPTALARGRYLRSS
jgi:hypothetical protein